MPTTDSRYEVKGFLYRLSLKLTKEQSNALVIIYELPAALRDQSPFDVIMQLEMQRKYTTLEELAVILKSICRDDLAKEVTTFAKKNKIILKNASPELFRPPNYDSQRNLECALQMTKLQFTILVDQMKKLQEAAAIEPGHKRIEQRTRNELKSASDKMFKELQYISTLLRTIAAGKWPESLSGASHNQIEQTTGNQMPNKQPHTQSTGKPQSMSIDDVNHDDDTDCTDSGFEEAKRFLKMESKDSTDDDYHDHSGFAEASQFIKPEPTQKPTLPPVETEPHKLKAGYRRLTMSTQHRIPEAPYDTAKNCLHESAHHDSGTDPVYQNFPIKTGARK